MVELLRNEGYNVIPVEEQMVPDGEFSTLKSPNPEESSAFEYSLKLGKEVDADILIATDPDADRMGIAAKDNNGEYVLLTGNQTGAILLNYLALNVPHDSNSCVYNTIVTSNIAKDICEKHNLTLVQTLTGFKFIGEQAALIEGTEKSFFFGYEESYGSVIKPFVRDKDSFQATLLLAEVASYYKEQGKLIGIDATQDIESIARTCYKSNDLITDDSNKKFISNLVKRKHWAMLEHYIFIYEIDNNFMNEYITTKEAQYQLIRQSRKGQN